MARVFTEFRFRFRFFFARFYRIGLPNSTASDKNTKQKGHVASIFVPLGRRIFKSGQRKEGENEEDEGKEEKR